MLYHGTSYKHLQDILKHGIKPRGDSSVGNWDHSCHSNAQAVYLTNAYALYFAGAALKEDAPTGTPLVVLEVDEALLDSSRLHADEDALEQMGRGRDGLPKSWTMKRRNEYYKKKMTDYSHTLSLQALGNCTYFGTVPCEAIKRVAIVEQQVYSEMMLRGYDPVISIMNYRLLGDRYRDASKWLFDPDTVNVEIVDLGLVKQISLPVPETRAGILVSNFDTFIYPEENLSSPSP